MSEAYFSTEGGYIVANLDLHSNGVYGAGSGDRPVLIVSLSFAFNGPKRAKSAMDFHELRSRLSPFDSVYIADSLPTFLRFRITTEQQISDQFVQVDIPLDRSRLAAINRMRSGGDVKLRLDLELFADELVEVHRIEEKWQPSVWGLYKRHQMQSKLNLVIPRSRWVEQVLVATEFAKTHLIELPAIPLETCAGMKSAFEALQQAVKLEKEGFYDEAAGRCRVALEPFCETVEKDDGKGGKIRIQKLKAAWQTRLGQSTYDWLNSAFGAVRGATNRSHHLTSTSFGQTEAQMLLTVTTALVAYAVKTQAES